MSIINSRDFWFSYQDHEIRVEHPWALASSSKKRELQIMVDVRDKRISELIQHLSLLDKVLTGMTLQSEEKKYLRKNEEKQKLRKEEELKLPFANFRQKLL
jgi:hypothetical protein